MGSSPSQEPKTELKSDGEELGDISDVRWQTLRARANNVQHGACMKPDFSGKVVLNTFFLLVLFGSMISLTGTTQSFYSIISTGSINYWPRVDVTINLERVIGLNNLSLGFMLDGEWRSWLNSPALREKAALANFRLIRLFDFRIAPALYWNESSKTGVFDWTVFDTIVRSIFEVGAEPMITLGHYFYGEGPRIPSGMAINPSTDLPYPESFGAYAAELVQHFEDLGLGVRYWEIWNEPWLYFLKRAEDGSITGSTNETRLAAFVDLFNVTSRLMRDVNTKILLGTDASLLKVFLDYFVQNGEDVEFLSFHKYDSGGTWLSNPLGYLSDHEILQKAGRFGSLGIYTPEEARQIWRERRGVDVPVILSETNLNSAWKNGTDPRIQQTIGAVWYTEVLRTSMLAGVSYSVYYRFASDAAPYWNTSQLTKGAGFGMVNMTSPHDEWYPYFVNYLFGNNLEVGDIILHALSSNSTMLSVLAWKHDNRLKVVFNGKVSTTSIAVELQFLGLQMAPGVEVAVYKVDSSKSQIQTEVTTYIPRFLYVKGYTVILMSISFNV